MKNKAAQTTEISMVWPKSGSRISGTIVSGSTSRATALPTSVGAPTRPPSAKAQAAITTNAGLTNSDGCTPPIHRREPLTSTPNISASTTSAIAIDEDDQRRAAHAARREERHADHHRGRRQQQLGLTIDEMEGREIEPLGDRRAGGERHHHADHHQRGERTQQPRIDGAEPIGDRPALGSRHHRSVSLDCLVRGGDPRRRQGAEAIAAHFKIGELVVGRAGRRQQRHRFGRLARQGVARRGGDRVLQRPAALEVDGAVERPGELVARSADQIGLGDAREQRPQRLDAARLGFAAEDPEDVVETQQRFFGRVGVGRLRNR